jgi:ABC-2 type transport system ATP-binding protein
MEELLTVRGLSRSYGEHRAIEGLDFRLRKGEVLGLLGPNGAGKTTCLQVLSGNLAPGAGEIRVRGLDMTRHPLRAKRHIGYLPERPPLYLDMRVDEYLDYCARLHRIPNSSRRQAVEDVISRCGLADLRRRTQTRLSKGYRQRAGIAQAIIHRPDLIILDEPTDGLDPLQIYEVRNLIRDLSADCGIILSSHILPEVQAVCTKVMILKDGRMLHQSGMEREETELRARRYRIRLESPQPPEALSGLAGVAAAQCRGDGAFSVTLHPGTSPVELAAKAVELGWGLAELTTDRTDLEQVFFDILGGEQAA